MRVFIGMTVALVSDEEWVDSPDTLFSCQGYPGGGFKMEKEEGK